MTNPNKKSKQNLFESDSENKLIAEFPTFIVIEETPLAFCSLSWFEK